ncbi:hypothetical protein Zmor_021929 [Zophobas morio]|uniref:Ig-like domain-containing protein n=1 Tax=Zophobas morio TaxID=2755281 RepID=A0AA38I6Y7_9CUCU|nr:hypothetical protein Zmor_021929 [Zophobas morio]
MKVKCLVKILIFTLLVSPANPIFSNALKKLKQKSKEAYKKKFGKDKTWHFLGHDLTEFPGTNENYRQINKEKWDEYYACLMAQNTNLGRTMSITPESLQIFESTSVRLDCKLCLSPEESTRIDLVKWYWASLGDKKLRPVDYTETVLLSQSSGSLQLYNVQKQQSGQYVCRIAKVAAPPYFLTVVESSDEDLEEVHALEAPSGPYPRKPYVIPGFNLIVDTEWTPWTSCTKCNQIGRRYRIGYCVVKYQENTTTINTDNATNTTETITIPQKDYELLQIFKFGISCQSHLLPHSVKLINAVATSKNQVMSGYCKTSCPENKVFEVRDKNGNVIERANNSAGIYSVLQGIPSIQPSVTRFLQYEEKGKHVVLSCPGNLNSDVPVEWQIGSRKLIPELLVSESQGRMYISITDKVHIKDAKISDTNIYR